MKQVLLDLKTGDIRAQEVPAPQCHPDGVLVQTRYSLISAGTESSTIQLAESSLLGKAKKRPDLAKKVLNKAKQAGPITAFQQAMNRLDKPEALGYSCAGTVVKVGENVTDLRVGDRVACAGTGFATHAEINYVPRNLCAKVPTDVPLKHAAFTTVGAIGLHGVRLADLQLGETVVVIGLGLVGQLVQQLVTAAGCNAIGIDLDESKVRLAKELGASAAFNRQEEGVEEKIQEITGGHGPDAVLIAAGTSSNDPIELAGRIARERGRVVVIGAVSMDVPRNLYYEKELSVYVSRSYGPGRYDRAYEERGQDYPIQYIRWTEQRNMQALLEQIQKGRVDVSSLVTEVFAIGEAREAYEYLQGDQGGSAVGVLLECPETGDPQSEPFELQPAKPVSSAAPSERPLRLGVIGAGVYGTSTFLPAVADVEDLDLFAIASATGTTAKTVGDKFGFRYCTTDVDNLLHDDRVDAVAILTRNDLHAPLTIKALEAGKHVFVEKPLAITPAELREVIEVYHRTPGHLSVGFNRRYSQHVQRLRSFLGDAAGPLQATYRVNAEAIPEDHWIYDDHQGGGRLITEVCHFVDLLQYVFGSSPTSVSCFSLGTEASDRSPSVNENVTLNLQFANGSVGSVVYTNAGDPSMPKEIMEIFGGGKGARLTDFRKLELASGGSTQTDRRWLSQAKGHQEELRTFADECREPGASRQSVAMSFRTTAAIFAAQAALSSGQVERADRFGVAEL